MIGRLETMAGALHHSSFRQKHTSMCKIVTCLLQFLIIVSVSNCYLRHSRYSTQTMCFPRDSCRGALLAVSQKRSCQCDNNCHLYDDCCWDADRRYSTRALNVYAMECHRTSYYHGYYVMSYCKKGWRERYIEKKCTERADITNPLSRLPVTSARTRISYKNYYCAICNDDSSDLVFWLTVVECPTLFSSKEEKKNVTTYVRQRFTYNPYCRQWGVWLHGAFHKCKMALKPPDYYKYGVFRPCSPNVTSYCSSTWREEVIRRKCISYTATVFSMHGQGAFRNVHCAMCNYVDVTSLSCMPPRRGRHFRASSFTILLDVRSKNCKEGEFYDPFFRKCRNFVCGFANRVLVNGKCIRVG